MRYIFESNMFICHSVLAVRMRTPGIQNMCSRLSLAYEPGYHPDPGTHTHIDGAYIHLLKIHFK